MNHFAIFLIILLLIHQVASASPLTPGDIVLYDNVTREVLLLDPNSGATASLATVGNTSKIVVDPTGTIVLFEGSTHDLLRQRIDRALLDVEVVELGGKRADVSREVATALRPYVDQDGVAFPIEAHVATARK